jgi:CheY-like chemotaxis protein
MPVKDGWAFLVERNQDSGLSSIPVIVLSACEGVEQAVAAANARYVPKPVRTDNLIEAIEHVAR